MRLTLRTLLAYRDGVLSPTETSDLHQRIRQTEVANNLLRRVENLLKQKELLAPKVSGQGLGGDANTVAEYLDDTLASEQVPEFERICIVESDLVLAELAHCHQLLAEALHSQVIVPPNLRSLAVSLSSPQNQAALTRQLKIGVKSSKLAGRAGSILRADYSHPENLVVASEVQAVEPVASQRSQVQAPMVTSGGGSIKPQGLDLERPQLAHEVPEYLVGQQIGGWRIPLAIGAMIALLSVISWQALGPLNNVRDLFVASHVASDSETSGPQKNSIEPAPSKAEMPNAQDSGAPDSSAPDSSAPDSSARGSSARGSNNAASASALDPNANNSVNSANDTITADTATSAVQHAAAKNDAANAEVIPQGVNPPNNTFRWTPIADDARSVLFVRTIVDGTTSLNRIAANAPLPADSEIVVPPSMRPTLNLASRCSWSVCGPTLMQLSKTENVTITTSLCRAITKAGAQGRNISIAAPTGSVNLQFEDATSMAAVEVAYRPVSHGSLTDKLVFKPFLIIVAVEGQVTVTPIRDGTESKSLGLVVGEGVAFTDGQPIEFKLGAIPTWYRAGNDRPLDSLAATDLDKSITDNRDAAAQLKDLCSDRRPETAALAIQTEMLMGEWSDFAGDFLNNEMMRTHWSAALGLAEQLIAAKEQNAGALRTAFEAAHPGRGDALFTLLVGSTDSSQPKELLPKLVESLGSTELAERVLAAHQLRRLTGKDMGFQPSIPNRAALQQWRRVIATSSSLLPLDSPIWEAKKPILNKR